MTHAVGAHDHAEEVLGNNKLHLSNKFLAPNSCTHCRRTHKKCDKKLPTCSLCTARGRQCVYESVGKRGPKSHADQARPYPTKTSPQNYTSPQESLPISHNYQYVVHDPAFVFKMNVDLPIIPRERMDQHLDYIAADLKGLSYMLPKPDQDELAFMYSMQAGINKCYGRHDAAQYMFEKGRALLAEKFEDVLENFTVASSFVFMAMYCAYNGEIERAQFFSLNVKTFICSWKNNQEGRHPCFDFLVHMYTLVRNVLDGETDIEAMLKEYIVHHLVVQNHYKQTKDPILAAIRDTPLDEFNLEGIKSDLCQNTHNYDLDCQKISLVRNRMDSMYDRMQMAGLPGTLTGSKKMYVTTFILGTKLQKCLNASVHTPMCERIKDVADEIARLSTSPDFASLPSTVTVVISLAARAHISLAQKTENLTELLEIAERMREELLTLITFGERTKLVKLRCEDVINELSQELRRIDEKLMVTRFDTFITKPLEPFPTYNFAADYLAEFTLDVPTSSSEQMIVPIENSNSFSSSMSLEDELLTFDAVDMFFKDFV
jgi:hypothetical protein